MIRKEAVAIIAGNIGKNPIVSANGFMSRDLFEANDKESNFYVLKKTVMPAILSENFFMTNYSNCHNYLLSEEGRDRIAKIHFDMIKEVEIKTII